MRRFGYASSAVAVVVLTGCGGMSAGRFEAKMRNTTAPDFELTALDGGKVKLSEQRGKPVLLAFWAFG